MIDSVVTFKWKPLDGYRSHFQSKHVNTSFSMVKRCLPGLKRFICVTDDRAGLDTDIEVVDLWNDFGHLRNPTWAQGPSCFRRLKVFSDEFCKIAGERFACIDLDMVFTGDVTPLFERVENFVIWNPSDRHIEYCASVMLVRAGTMRNLYYDFDPASSPATANEHGFRGSDQGWMAYWARLNKVKFATWSKQDGVFSYRYHLRGGPLPPSARIVVFHGKPDPWDSVARMNSPWIKEHYR